jgi:hypothetical protein
MFSLQRQIADDPSVVLPRIPPRLERCDYAGILDSISQILSEKLFEQYVELDRSYEQMVCDLVLLRANIPSEQQLRQAGHAIAPLDHFDELHLQPPEAEQEDEPADEHNHYSHLSEQELEEYFFDRRMTL